MIPACLALLFAPFPFLLYKYGHSIRAKCKFSAEAMEFLKQLQGQSNQPDARQGNHARGLAENQTQHDRDDEEQDVEKDREVDLNGAVDRSPSTAEVPRAKNE